MFSFLYHFWIFYYYKGKQVVVVFLFRGRQICPIQQIIKYNLAAYNNHYIGKLSVAVFFISIHWLLQTQLFVLGNILFENCSQLLNAFSIWPFNNRFVFVTCAHKIWIESSGHLSEVNYKATLLLRFWRQVVDHSACSYIIGKLRFRLFQNCRWWMRDRNGGKTICY